MPIAIAQTDTYESGNSTPATHTKSITAGAGLSMIMVACHTAYNGGTVTNKVDTVTVNGVSATEVTAARSADSTARRTQLFFVLSPASGTYNVVATPTAAQRLALTIHQLTGTHLSAPIRGGAATTGTSGALTLDIASAVGDMVLDAILLTDTTYVLTVDGSQTQDSNFTLNAGVGGVVSGVCGTSHEAGAAGNVTMSWTRDSGTSAWAMSAVSLIPADSSASPMFVLRRRQ